MKKLNKLEVRILELLKEARIENRGNTVVFRSQGLSQHKACMTLSLRRLVKLEVVAPQEKKGKMVNEVSLTAAGLHHVNKIKAGV